MERRTASAPKTVKSITNGIEPPSKEIASKPQDKDWLARAEIVLEFVQGKRRLSEKSKLIQPLFRLLKM
jgi:hypothetical protein